MKNGLKTLGLIGICCTVAAVLFVILAPARGWYFSWNEDHAQSTLIPWYVVSLGLLGGWAALSAHPKPVCVSGSLALACLIGVNLLFSAGPYSKMTVGQMLVVLVCFWFLPLACIICVKAIPRFGIRLGKLTDDKIHVAKRCMSTTDWIAVTLFIGSVVAVLTMAVGTQRNMVQEDLFGDGRVSLQSGISYGLTFTGVFLLLLMTGLNCRRWLFVVAFACVGFFVASNLYAFSQNESVGNVAIGAVLVCSFVTPIAMRLANYRITTKRNVVQDDTEVTKSPVIRLMGARF